MYVLFNDYLKNAIESLDIVVRTWVTDADYWGLTKSGTMVCFL